MTRSYKVPDEEGGFWLVDVGPKLDTVSPDLLHIGKFQELVEKIGGKRLPEALLALSLPSDRDLMVTYFPPVERGLCTTIVIRAGEVFDIRCHVFEDCRLTTPVGDSLLLVADLDATPPELVVQLMRDLDALDRAMGGTGLYVRSVETGSAVPERAVA